MENQINLNKPLLKATDVAEMLNVSKAMAYKLINSGQIRSVVIGTAIRVRSEDLFSFIENSLTPSSELET